MRPVHILFSCFVVAVCIAGYAVMSEDGLTRRNAMSDEVDSLDAQVTAAQGRNVRLAEEAKLLSGTEPGSDAHLERVAREKHGYIGKDEVVVLVGDEPAP